jgi:TPP-dependent pyruvate/acetoin dehydrogenase alpha subunit
VEPDRVALYRRMLTCRRVEEAIAVLWQEGQISGEMHLGIGEEGINAGVLDHLGDGDAVALDHRGTAGMVLRGVDVAAIVKECMGAVDGPCGGMGGHMHLYSKDHLAASSGIVGASGPTACGFALAAQHLRPGKIAAAFFGEAAMNQGMLMEAMNLAAAWELPVLFVCRDNGMAITTPSAAVTGGDLEDRARGLGVPLLRIARRPLAELKPRLGSLVSAATASQGASIGQRVAGLGDVVSVLGRVARTELGSPHDPVARLRKRLAIASDALARLESEVELAVRGAVEAALRPNAEAGEGARR